MIVVKWRITPEELKVVADHLATSPSIRIQIDPEVDLIIEQAIYPSHPSYHDKLQVVK